VKQVCFLLKRSLKFLKTLSNFPKVFFTQNQINQIKFIFRETCIEGLRLFQGIASSIEWETEIGQKFIPILSRKLIDFFKSPRSNLCRTACQTAGEFFKTAKSTKRPEFDEMIDILLCKTSDPNRFIQKDASVALEKMAEHICVHHSVRAVCAKGPEHKNSVVRSSTARLLYAICKAAGVDQIVGTDSNPRTRKRVLTNLAKFLMDKNQDTRRHAEKLCKMLKRHKFFLEYFFKDIENNQKHPLRKILNALEAK
jgi:CLASP N terminal